jgi:hypothetical protein
MSTAPGRACPIPTVDQHTDEILVSLLGDEATHLASLRAAKVIA